jgi:hypothetical protein
MNKDTYFLDTLRDLVTVGTLPPGHPLASCPADSLSAGTNLSEKAAIRELRRLAGERWAYELRRLHYGFVQADRRVSALRAGLIYLCLDDSELRALLRARPDIFELPHLQLWDETLERKFYEKIKAIDERKAG